MLAAASGPYYERVLVLFEEEPRDPEDLFRAIRGVEQSLEQVVVRVLSKLLANKVLQRGKI